MYNFWKVVNMKNKGCEYSMFRSRGHLRIGFALECSSERSVTALTTDDLIDSECRSTWQDQLQIGYKRRSPTHNINKYINTYPKVCSRLSDIEVENIWSTFCMRDHGLAHMND